MKGLFQILLLLIFPISHAQNNYNPFQYGSSPTTLPTPKPQSLEQLRKENQIKINQQNSEILKKFGFEQPPSQEQIIANQKNLIQGLPPKPSKQELINKEIQKIMWEISMDEKKKSTTNYYDSELYKNDLEKYKSAQDKIKNMLNGNTALSLQDAYYYCENAYGQSFLGYTEYKNIVAENAKFITTWLMENKYDITNSEAIHYGIQKFLSDTLYIHSSNSVKGHLPYYYDYIDATGLVNKQNYFVTKTIATGGGQCHTMPVLYLILAETLNIEAFEAYNPRHTFIRFVNASGTIVNYEATIDKFLPDQFYLETLPVMAKSMKNNIYINTLDKKHSIATILYELGVNYIQEHGITDLSFVQECMKIADTHFPSQDFICLARHNLQKVILAKQFNQAVKKFHIQNLSQITNYPEAHTAYLSYYDYIQKIADLGIQDFPEEEYLQLLSYYDTKSKIQISKNIQAKTKKSLFIH